jgi:glycosyltransferase involved in cell wall biosynthesis
MNLRDKNILLISPEPWKHIHVSKHHYAIHLGQRGNRVFFLGPPGNVDATSPTTYPNVSSVQYTGFPRGLRFYPRVLQRYFLQKRFAALAALCDSRFDIVWSFDNSVFFDFSALPSDVLTISHIVDSTQNFQFDRAASTATLCLGVTREIVGRLKKSNPRSFFIQHGYAQRKDTADLQLPGNHPIRVGYAGNLNLRYIDWKMLDHVISGHAEAGFYFAGPYRQDHEGVNRLKTKPNVYFIGEMPSEKLAAFYGQMDVLLLCYLAEEYPEQLANSHKMMEYLGSGKMIVATHTAEFRLLHDNELLLMSNRNAEFPDRLRQALADLGRWNGSERANLRRQWADENSYEKQLMRIEELLNKSIIR